MKGQNMEDHTFRNVNFCSESLPVEEFDNCTFIGCDFSNVKLSHIRFLEIEFIDCNFSNAILGNTSFQTVDFKNCKMLGLQFDACDSFGFAATFYACQLDHCSFYGMTLNRSVFKNCHMEGVDFSGADLKSSQLVECNLLHAIFEDTNLEGVDLRKSMNYAIDPERNRIRHAKFSLPEVIGLLDKYSIVVD